MFINFSRLFKTEGYRLKKYLLEQRYYPIAEVQPQDIFIAGYPKSGNTWMQNLAAGVIFGLDTRYLPDRLTQELIPDIYAKKYYKRFMDFAVFKTHELPRPEYKRVVHLVRDGRDALASYYAMNKALNIDVTLEEMILHGKELYPCRWHEHAKAWLENSYDADIIRIKYEDLLKDPLKEMRKFCKFIGIERQDDLIIRVIRGNHFNVMQEKEKKYGTDNKRWKPSKKFFRKGKIGSYKEEIPPRLIRSFNNQSEYYLKKFGYKIEE